MMGSGSDTAAAHLVVRDGAGSRRAAGEDRDSREEDDDAGGEADGDGDALPASAAAAGAPSSRIGGAVAVNISETDGFWSLRKCLLFVGPGFFVSVGYLDPGNWATDIEGGSRFGYSLLWVIFMSNLCAILLQTLSARLGLVTELSLAQLCRSQYPRAIGYTLWVLCEIAIVAMDLAEVLGTAIGLLLLFRLPLILGVLITGADTLLFLAIQRAGIRKLEAIVGVLLGIVVVCFAIELVLSRPSPAGIARGLIPKLSRSDGSLYVAVSMLGATVMPHNLYLHSAMVLSRTLPGRTVRIIRRVCAYNLIDSVVALNAAFLVNAAILIVAAANFYARNVVVTKLEDAHDLLEDFLDSRLAAICFGLGLFAAGQSSTITGTMAGQVVMEGFLHIRVPPWSRRLATRLLALVPAIVVIIVMGNEGTYRLLILSQVVLSLQLPFAVVPLVRFTSSRRLMHGFANGRIVLVLAITVAVVILGLNAWLVGEQLATLATHPSAAARVLFVFLIPVVAALLLLLVYLAIHPTVTVPLQQALTECCWRSCCCCGAGRPCGGRPLSLALEASASDDDDDSSDVALESLQQPGPVAGE